MNFDLALVPFSRFGSYMAVAHLSPKRVSVEGLYLKTIRHAGRRREVFRIELLEGGTPVPFRETATPTRLRLECASGFAELVMPGPDVIRGRAEGVGVRLIMDQGTFNVAFPARSGRWEVNAYENRAKFMLTPIAGTLVVEAPWEVQKCNGVRADFVPGEEGGAVEFAIEEYRSSLLPREYEGSFDDAAASVEREFGAWLANMPSVPGEFEDARELAAYINWSSVVAPEGNFKRPAMLMSKNQMTNLWSWDHCFNAWALSYGEPDCAWSQLMVPYDLQDETGALPDGTNEIHMGWNFVKPPIHGWVLSRMMEAGGWIDEARLIEIYPGMVRQTEWWFKYRDYDGSGLPQYCHGNDSGWDNATVFHEGAPVKGPDLAAYLVIQMEVLSEIAAKLGKADESAAWKKRSEEFLAKMLAELWDGEKFIAPRVPDGNVVESDCLLARLPVVLGKRLPEDVRAKLVADLSEEGRFLTEHGLATESVRSPRYVADGYWRGPIWAPSTMIVVDGLRQLGEIDLAKRIARSFCEMCAASGFAENFDALTGEGLRDKAYTWTSSVFLVLAHEYL